VIRDRDIGHADALLHYRFLADFRKLEVTLRGSIPGQQSGEGKHTECNE
jgi:hypothetical protein